MNRKGFTIIELLIVMAVIAILVGIAIPRIKGMQDEAKITKAKTELKTLQTAVESYAAHHDNTYPTAIGDITNTSPLIVQQLPTDPFSLTRSVYGYNTAGLAYVIYSVGASGGASASVSGTDVIESDPSCIFVSNVEIDTRP